MLGAVALVVIGVVDVLGFSLVLASVVRRLSSVGDFGFTYKLTNLLGPYLHGGWMLALRSNRSVISWPYDIVYLFERNDPHSLGRPAAPPARGNLVKIEVQAVFYGVRILPRSRRLPRR